MNTLDEYQKIISIVFSILTVLGSYKIYTFLTSSSLELRLFSKEKRILHRIALFIIIVFFISIMIFISSRFYGFLCNEDIVAIFYIVYSLIFLLFGFKVFTVEVCIPIFKDLLELIRRLNLKVTIKNNVTQLSHLGNSYAP